MLSGHLITATVMTLGVCQGHSSIASFSILTSASRGPCAIAELFMYGESFGWFGLIVSGHPVLICIHYMHRVNSRDGYGHNDSITW